MYMDIDNFDDFRGQEGFEDSFDRHYDLSTSDDQGIPDVAWINSLSNGPYKDSLIREYNKKMAAMGAKPKSNKDPLVESAKQELGTNPLGVIIAIIIMIIILGGVFL